MKKLLFCTIMLIAGCLTMCNAQTIGGNGEGLTEKYLPEDVTLMQQLGKFAVCWPGGSTAKYTYARLNVAGYGFRLDSIYAWNDRFGKDENGSDNLAADIRDYEQDSAAARSYLYDLADIQYATGCDIIWKVNIFSSPAEVIASVNDYLSIRKNENINWRPSISYFVLGNELYFIDLNGDGKTMDGDLYISRCVPYIDALNAAFSIPIALNYAQDVSSSGHRKFNSAVVNYVKNNAGKIDGVDTHPYLNESILGDAYDFHPSYIPNAKSIKRIPYSTVFNDSLAASFMQYVEIFTTTDYYRKLIDTIHKQLPGIELLTTEFQTNPISLSADVIANAAYLFYVWTTYRSEFKYLCAHNMLGNYDFAFIENHAVTPKYYALQLANKLPVNYYDAQSNVIIPEDSGTYYIRYMNMSGIPSKFFITLPFEGSYTLKNSYLYGNEIYSAMGNAPFYNKSPKQNVEVFYVDGTGDEIQAYSFGVLEIKVTKAEEPCKIGCMDLVACNYDPDATCPGTCTYKKRFMFFEWCPRVKKK